MSWIAYFPQRMTPSGSRWICAMTPTMESGNFAERVEAELGEERSASFAGCPAEWANLPIPEGRIVVGLDGGYVRNWDDRKRTERR